MLDIDRISIIPTSHLDLFWLGDYRNCLERGDDIIRRYLDRADESGDETFIIDTAIFAEHFLQTHPHYEPLARRLIAEGRLEIGGAYIDRWENLVLGESLIRNIQIGRRWVKDRLGVDCRLAAHPDLPGLNSQTAQIYAQAGIRYYVTSRKIFHEGRVWRHISPDGTKLHVLHWPVHYVFVPFRPGTVDASARGNFIADRSLAHEDLRSRYPHGTLAMSGGAGDLTGPEDFITRYGKDQRAFVEQFRIEFPDVEIDYAVPATVMQPYLDDPVEVEERTGTFPSVWGVAPDEEMRFFHRVRALERDLLDAETGSVIAHVRGDRPLPESARTWRGLYGEDAFYAPDDHAPEGREMEWLWRMQVFTQDHNGGGEDGALSVFQKKVRHDRARHYAREVLEHTAAGERPDEALLFTSTWGGEQVVVVEPEQSAAVSSLLSHAPHAGRQELVRAAGGNALALAVDVPDRVGLHALHVLSRTSEQTAAPEDDRVVVTSPDLQVSVARATGSVSLSDSLGEMIKALSLPYAVRERGNDVTLVTDEDERVDASLTGVELLGRGPLATQVAVGWELLDVKWRQILTIWADRPAMDIDIDVEWPALENWQVRLPLLPTAQRDQLSYGTPFHGSSWEEMPDGAQPFQRDEISVEDQAAYREVQHWVAAQVGASRLAILTGHPAFRCAAGETSAVLMRTAPSCGDQRLHWTNPGRTTWQFRLQMLADHEAPATLADHRWRAPRVLIGGAEPLTLLENEGDDVRVSALFLDEDLVPCVRLVNQSDEVAQVTLSGRLASNGAELVNLDGVRGARVAVSNGRTSFALDPWRIQTLKFNTTTSYGTGA